jgi:hypothetical protein
MPRAARFPGTFGFEGFLAFELCSAAGLGFFKGAAGFGRKGCLHDKSVMLWLACFSQALTVSI